jgi:hypothetical protein
MAEFLTQRIQEDQQGGERRDYCQKYVCNNAEPA